MANPKILYDAGAGPVTLTFLRAPRLVPAYEYAAVRHDNISSAGVRETVYERSDTFVEFEMEWVGSGADVTAWNSFISWALKGGQFSYYPDSSLTAFTNYWLENVEWVTAYKTVGQYTFRMKFRQAVT